MTEAVLESPEYFDLLMIAGPCGHADGSHVLGAAITLGRGHHVL
jgi:hypothetical protein